MKHKSYKMLSYIKLYVVKDRKVHLRKMYINEPAVKNRLISIISEIFNAIDIDVLINRMMNVLENVDYVSFEIFSHVAEIHLFKLAPGTKDLNILELIPICDKHEITSYTLLHRDSDDDDDDNHYERNIQVRT